MIGRILFPCGVLVFALAYGVRAQGFPVMGLQEGFGPGLFPTVIAIVVFIFAAIEAARQVMAHNRLGREAADCASRAAPGVTRQEIVSASIVATAIVATILLMPYVGFIAASATLLLCLTVVMGMRPLWKCAACSALVAGCLYLVFAEGFGVIFAF